MDHHHEPEQTPTPPKVRKPFHKHIGHHARRIHRTVTKYLYERDTIFATLWVFIFILMVKYFPFNLHPLDPMKLALQDFDFTDIAYAKLGKGKDVPMDSNIVVVNIGHLDREGLAMVIQKTASMNPKVIGLDAYFDSAHHDHGDTVLREVFEKTPNLVSAGRLRFEHHGEEMEVVEDYFREAYHHTGYVNLVGEEKGSIREFSPSEDYKGKPINAFATEIVRLFNPDAGQHLLKRHNPVEVINYLRRPDKYFTIRDPQEFLATDYEPSLFKGKIVLLGYLNKDEFDIEDMKFTPMNEKFAGKSVPDMSGILVHANIISMVLEGNYVKKLPLWFTILTAVIIGWLHMSFFIRYYLEDHIWFHLVAKIAQLISAFFFVWLGMVLFDRYRLKLDMSLTLVVIILAVDIIYFYEAFAVWLHKKFGYRTVFHLHHHG